MRGWVFNLYRRPVPRRISRRRARWPLALLGIATLAWGAILAWPAAEPLPVRVESKCQQQAGAGDGGAKKHARKAPWRHT